MSLTLTFLLRDFYFSVEMPKTFGIQTFQREADEVTAERKAEQNSVCEIFCSLSCIQLNYSSATQFLVIFSRFHYCF